MTKVSSREAVGTLLGGVGCLVGTYLLGFKMPSFPEECRREHSPYNWCRHIDGICQDFVPRVTLPSEESSVMGNNPKRGRVTRR